MRLIIALALILFALPAQSMTLDDAAALTGRTFGTAIGSSTGYSIYAETAYAAIADSEFSLIKAENQHKFYSLQTAEGVFSFTNADNYVTRAAITGQNVFGHTLVWKNQLPTWLTEGSFTNQQKKDILQDHIETVLSHFGNSILEWDVVNEAADGGYWADAWTGSANPYEWVEQSFIWARAAAHEDVKLFYNDYGFEFQDETGTRGNAIYNMIDGALSRDVPIDGIGFQSHFSSPITETQLTNLRFQLQRYSDLGLEIHISELDIGYHTGSWEQQAEDYYNFMSVVLEYPAVTSITIWGFTDKYTWRAGQQPLLWDEDYNKKPAYFAVRQALIEAAGGEVDIPTLSNNRPTGTYAAGTTITLSATDASTVGIQYRWDEGAWQTYSTPLTIQAGTLDAYAIDQWENESAVQSFIYAIGAPTNTTTDRLGNPLTRTDRLGNQITSAPRGQ